MIMSFILVSISIHAQNTFVKKYDTRTMSTYDVDSNLFVEDSSNDNGTVIIFNANNTNNIKIMSDDGQHIFTIYSVEAEGDDGFYKGYSDDGLEIHCVRADDSFAMLLGTVLIEFKEEI